MQERMLKSVAIQGEMGSNSQGTAPEQKPGSLSFPLSFHQIDANQWQHDRSGPVLLSRLAKVDAK